jgi:hypothetical protein
MVLRPIPDKLVKMLNETFKYNNPHLNLVKAWHREQSNQQKVFTATFPNLWNLRRF